MESKVFAKLRGKIFQLNGKCTIEDLPIELCYMGEANLLHAGDFSFSFPGSPAPPLVSHGDMKKS